MKARFMNNTIAFLQKYNTYSKEDIEKLEYGLEGIYLTITKLIILFFIATLLGVVKEFITLLLLNNMDIEVTFEVSVLSLKDISLTPKNM